MFVTFDPKRERFKIDDRAINPASALSSRLLLAALIATRPYAHGRLLDVGCGAKPYRALFKTTEHLGTDWSKTLHHSQADVEATADNLPFEDGRFDTVLCTEVVEHLPSAEAGVAEMVRVLRPGGHLIVSAPLVHGLHEMPYDYRRFTIQGMRHLAETAGLEPVALFARGGTGSVLVDLAARQVAMFESKWLRRARVPAPWRRALLRATVSWPLRAVAVFARKEAARPLAEGAPGPYLTLGYVLVARKPGPAPAAP